MNTLGMLRDNPVPLKARTKVERLILEHAWLAECHPGARIIRRRWADAPGVGPHLDLVTVKWVEDDPHHVYFLIEDETPEQPVPGLSPEHAIQVGSVQEEYAWLRNVLESPTTVSQEIRRSPGGMLDRVTVAMRAGEPVSIWFDISSFFGSRD